MSKHRKNRITVEAKPTGVVCRCICVLIFSVGLLFAYLVFADVIPISGLLSLPFVAVGGLFTILGYLSSIGKKHRSPQADRTEDNKPGLGRLGDADSGRQQKKDGSISIRRDSSRVLSKEKMEQLKTLKAAGLITVQEYKERQQKIFRNESEYGVQ